MRFYLVCHFGCILIFIQCCLCIWYRVNIVCLLNVSERVNVCALCVVVLLNMLVWAILDVSLFLSPLHLFALDFIVVLCSRLAQNHCSTAPIFFDSTHSIPYRPVSFSFTLRSYVHATHNEAVLVTIIHTNETHNHVWNNELYQPKRYKDIIVVYMIE